MPPILDSTDGSDELQGQQHGNVLWLTIQRDHRRGRERVLCGCGFAGVQSVHRRLLRAALPSGPAAARRARQPHPVDCTGQWLLPGRRYGPLAMCDVAVASSHAVFGLPEVKVGVFPAQVLTVLQHLVPRRVLAEMCITGEPLTSAQALQYGLVNHVDDDVDAKLQWLLERVLNKSPAAIRRGLYTMKTVESMAFEESMAFTESQIASLTLTDDAREGQKAFQEKRPPIWTGT
jgi:hypothetical protein